MAISLLGPTVRPNAAFVMAKLFKIPLPRSLFGRALAILLVPIVVLQLVVGLVFFQRHYQRVTAQMTESVAFELRYAVEEADTADTAQEAARRLSKLGEPLALILNLAPDKTVIPGTQRSFFDISGATLVETLEFHVRRPIAIDLVSDNRAALIEVPTRFGAMTTSVPRSRLTVSNPHQLLVLMLAASIVLSTIAVLFLRNQIRPIRRLAEASEAFGKGRPVPFRPTGAQEVRRAGGEFLAMRARIERQIEQRTQMLSGVSHDLRTPLTRMKLTLALMDESEEVRDLHTDVDQMERMVSEFLAFARGDSSEPSVDVDPFLLGEEIAEQARRAGTDVDLFEKRETTGSTLVELRQDSVTRAVQNLIANASRHGSTVRLTVRLTPRAASFVVEDDGPGIPEIERAAAVQPFSRLNSARGQHSGSGNVGLGLAIALDVARAHGGSLDLEHSTELGGLAATLRLPR